MKRSLPVIVFFGCALLALLFVPLLWGLTKTNYVALQTTHTLLSSQQASEVAFTSSNVCRDRWLLGFLFNSLGDYERRNTSWATAGSCDTRYIVLMHRIAPEDHTLALLVHKETPASAEAWFWSGDLTPEHAVEYYQHGLELDPIDANRWMTLAYLLESDNPQASLDAMVQACELGDPGENACWGAGHRYLALGDVQTAIQVLRKATWKNTLDLATQLELELESGK